MIKIKVFKVLSLFLIYPFKEQLALIDEGYKVLLTEKMVKKKLVQPLEKLLSYFQKTDLLSLQENYVQQFDINPSCSLHLFEHVYGESRERGQALVDLQEVYKKQGIAIKDSELPDYLPMFLEYLSLLPKEEALDALGETITIIATIGARLENQNSPYHVIFKLLIALSKTKPNLQKIADAIIKNPGKNDTYEDFDKNWAENPAFSLKARSD